MTTEVLSEKLSKFITPLGIPGNPFQKTAYNNLLTLDFPTTRNEYWKYTRVGKIANTTFRSAAKIITQKPADSLFVSPYYLVIENGDLREDLSNYRESGFVVNVTGNHEIEESFFAGSKVDQQHLFSALNTVYFNSVVTIEIPEKTQIEMPLQLLFVSSGEQMIANPRIRIKAGKGSSGRLIASFVSDGSTGNFTNIVSEFFLGENAQLAFNKIQNENKTTFHISTEQVVQEKDSTFRHNVLVLDGALVRSNLNISVSGNNCETHMNGAIIAKENQHIDNHTFVDHEVAHCFSNENYRYVLDGKSTGVFNGRVVVRKDAQKINAYQNNANVLLSDLAQIDSKPELEIYADDVKCSHGSTTGQLDEQAIFYLQTRGISKDKAKKLLVSAFISEILDQFDPGEQRDQIETILREKHNWTV